MFQHFFFFKPSLQSVYKGLLLPKYILRMQSLWIPGRSVWNLFYHDNGVDWVWQIQYHCQGSVRNQDNILYGILPSPSHLDLLHPHLHWAIFRLGKLQSWGSSNHLQLWLPLHWGQWENLCSFCFSLQLLHSHVVHLCLLLLHCEGSGGSRGSS